MENLLQAIFENILTGNTNEIESTVREALNASIPPERILNDAMIKAMNEVGTRFEHGEFYVPEMLIATRAMQKGLAILKPQLVKGGINAVGKVIMGTIKGDLHDIGKNLVGMMLKGTGFEVIDLGTDVSSEKLIDAIKAHNPQLIGLSALLTTTMVNIKSVIEAVDQAGLRGQIRIMVGGAPVTANYAQEIGADGYAPDASRAVAVAKTLLNV